MDKVFFDELDLRLPDASLEVGSDTPGIQTAAILAGVERLIIEEAPAAVIVHGDTNTTLGAALAACKHNGTLLVHVEAGTRSGNPQQPEEINRKLVDRVSSVHFVPLSGDLEHLRAEGVDTSNAFVTGSTVFDSCIRAATLPGREEILGGLGVQPGSYALATFHRQETVDNRERLMAVCNALKRIGESIPLILPIHPRTRKRVQEFGLDLESPGIRLTDPVGYRAMIALLSHAQFCLTDSGGLMEEAAALGIPGLILREETEHSAYVNSGIHTLVGAEEDRIAAEAHMLIEQSGERSRRAALRPTAPDRSPSEVILATLRRLLV
jgi:UDP-N-acetylglucosamine 2-epimerase